MIVPSIGRRLRRLAREIGVTLAFLLLLGGQLGAQAPICDCRVVSPFGSCQVALTVIIDEYQGNFPGPAAVIARPGQPTFLLFADLFDGQTYVFHAGTDGGGLLTGTPLVFPSPRGTLPTTGVAWNPQEERLYWTIGDRIVVTEAPLLSYTVTNGVQRVDAEGNVLPPVFENITVGAGTQAQPLELTIDLEALATEIGAETTGSLAGLTYHAGRNTLWTIDIVNDTYFELELDGSFSREGGEIVRFVSPVISDSNPKAFGNSLTYASTPQGEFFDVLVGTLIDGRPTRVVRLIAPTTPGDSPIGTPAGLSYSLFPGFLAETVPGTRIPTALAYWGQSCGAEHASELIMVYDSVGTNQRVATAAVDPPTVANVANLSCAPEGNSGIRLSWLNTGGYDMLEIFRASIAEPETEVLIFSTSGMDDPGTHLDTQLPIPVDGSYVYRAVATRGATTAPAVTCATTIGRGSILTGTNLATAVGKTRQMVTGFGVTATPEFVLVADALGSVGYRLDPQTLESMGEIVGPFAPIGGETTGVEWAPELDRLFWLGTSGETPLLIATRLDGTGPGPQRPVQFPLEFVRTPTLGDLAWDPVREQFWVTARSHGKVFAITPEGRLVAGSVIDAPGGKLGGGIEVAAADETSVTLDLIASETAGQLVRNRYLIDDLANPETQNIFALRNATGSAFLGGLSNGTRSGKDVIFLVASDIDRLFVLQNEDAELGSAPFRRGDVNDDGSVNISDPSSILGYLFRSADPPNCLRAADSNDDGAVDLSDALMLFNWLFRAGEPLPTPGVDCGFDPTPSGEELGCEVNACFGG